METIQRNERLSDACFDELIKLTHKLTGITIGRDRKSMIAGRIARRVRANGLPDFESYLGFLRENRSETEHFVDTVTTNKTYFYRTPRVWEFVTDVFLKNWIQEKRTGPLRAWSAAASTGEEAYTMGVVFQDLQGRHPHFAYSIFGTDISPSVIETAKEGLYPKKSIDPLRTALPDLFLKYLTGSNDREYQVIPAISQNIHFKTHNLFRPSGHSRKFDIVFLRNVLIYFTEKDQEHVLSHVHNSMRDDGILVIGESESLARLKTGFESVAPLIYRKGADQSRDESS